MHGGDIHQKAHLIQLMRTYEGSPMNLVEITHPSLRRSR